MNSSKTIDLTETELDILNDALELRIMMSKEIIPFWWCDYLFHPERTDNLWKEGFGWNDEAVQLLYTNNINLQNLSEFLSTYRRVIGEVNNLD